MSGMQVAMPPPPQPVPQSSVPAPAPKPASAPAPAPAPACRGPGKACLNKSAMCVCFLHHVQSSLTKCSHPYNAAFKVLALEVRQDELLVGQ
jgi:hypothetical protein